MYLQNKYTKWYNNIILQSQKRIAISSHTEKHHIIPRSLGGNNSKKNIAVLTPKEHFLCHLLLTKMVAGQAQFKMLKALTMMMGVKNIGKGRYIANSRWYAYAREQNRKNIDEYWTEKRRQSHSIALKKYNATVDKSNKKYLDRIEKIRKYQLNKVWTEKALSNLKDISVKSAKKRKGTKWTTKHRQSRMKTYVNKNLEIATKVFELADMGLNKRQISLRLNISWDKVKYSLLHRTEFQETLTGELKLPEN
jgi:hypothetical protein